MADAERVLSDLSRKEGVLGTVVMTDDGVPIRSDFPEHETNLYASLVAHFVQRTKKALDEMETSEVPEVIRVRSKKNEMVIVPSEGFVYVAVQDPYKGTK